MRIALIQMEVLEKNKKANVLRGLELLHKVEGADVAVLPEVWTTGYSLGALSREAELISGNLVEELSCLSKNKQLAIVAGSFAIYKDDGKIYNTALVFDKNGNMIAEYDKLYMFSLYNEQKYFSAGNKQVSFELEGILSGLGICYDLRFPELFRFLALQGVQIVYLPAEWPAARGDVWELLVRARAVENQIYVCAVNCVGKFRDKLFYGHSMLVAPDGKVLAIGSKKEEIIYADISRTYIEDVRSEMNVLHDVRRELY